MTRLNDLARFAKTHSIELSHPVQIADLLDRRAAAVALRPQPERKLDDVLLDLPIEKWERAISDRAKADAVRDLRAAQWQILPDRLDKAIDRLLADHLDGYLAQFDNVLADAETRLVDGAKHLTGLQLDPEVAIRNRVGDRLTDFDLGLTIVTSYASLLRQVVPRHTDNGLTVAAAAYALPPTLRPEQRTVVDQMRVQRTLTGDSEMAAIRGVRNTLEALSANQSQRAAVHAIANDQNYTIRCARNRAEFIDATERWKTVNRVEIVERSTEDKYISPSWGTVNI